MGMDKIPTAKTKSLNSFVFHRLTIYFISFLDQQYWFEYIYFAYLLLLYVQNFHHESHHDLALGIIVQKKLDSYYFHEASFMEEVGNK